jgi:hypothetical protein
VRKVTTNRSIVLRCSNGGLAIALDPQGVGGWSQVHLLHGESSRPLGAERIKYISAQLTSFLTDCASGRRWVLSLSELHGSLYGEHIGDDAILYVQDADANIAATLKLTSKEKAKWMSDLQSLK